MRREPVEKFMEGIMLYFPVPIPSRGSMPVDGSKNAERAFVG